MHILESTGLKQHVQGPAHYKGHTLDVLHSGDKRDILCNVQVTDIRLSDDDGNLTCDHYAVTQQLYGLDNVCKDWFESYLMIDHTESASLSDQNALKCVVPQGSVLGARLYSMYAYPFSNIIKKHNLQYHTYADDPQIYMQCKNNVESINEAISKHTYNNNNNNNNNNLYNINYIQRLTL